VYRKEIEFIILVILIITSSCRSMKTHESKSYEGNREINTKRLIKEVAYNNIIRDELTIGKIVINYKQEDERRRLRAYLKYDGSDKIMLSIRTFAGIEAARILIDKDSVKIMDKINKILYNGNNREMEEKYGLNYKLIKLILGDIEEIEYMERKSMCKDGVTKIKSNEIGSRNYYIDCKIGKIIAVHGSTMNDKFMYEGEYSKFNEEEGLLYPKKTKWTINNGEIIMDIAISNVRKRSNMNMIFRVPDNYIRKNIR